MTAQSRNLMVQTGRTIRTANRTIVKHEDAMKKKKIEAVQEEKEKEKQSTEAKKHSGTET